MGLSAQTAKNLAKILVEETNSPEVAEKVLIKWNDVKGINGNLRMIISEVLVFVNKLKLKTEKAKSDQE